MAFVPECRVHEQPHQLRLEQGLSLPGTFAGRPLSALASVSMDLPERHLAMRFVTTKESLQGGEA